MRICSVENCDCKHFSKGYCNKHYTQVRRHGRIIDEDIASKEVRICEVQNCNNKHFSKGYCKKHYSQFRRLGYTLEKTCRDLNEIIDCVDHAEIITYNSKGEETARALIDLENVDIVKDYKWRLNDQGYIVNDKVGRLHRFLTNPPDNMVVDHINHNKLDNRISNLRICTSQQNNMNTSKRSDNSSGVTGVYWDKQNNKWIASIQVNGKQIHLGYFKTKEGAVEARRQAEIEYFGEYRRVD